MDDTIDMPTSAWIAARLHKVRAARKLGNNEWASRAGIGAATLSKLLTQAPRGAGTEAPSAPALETVWRLCRAANVPLWALLHGNESVLDALLPQHLEGSVEMSEALSAVALLIDQQDKAMQRFVDGFIKAFGEMNGKIDRMTNLQSEQVDLVRKHLETTAFLTSRVDDLASQKEALGAGQGMPKPIEDQSSTDNRKRSRGRCPQD